MNETTTPKGKDANLDSWLAPHFRVFTDDAKRLKALVQLSTQGISALEQLPRIGEQIILLERQWGIYQPDEKIEVARELAELAKREIEEGFPITYSQFIVDIWGLLEASIRGFVALWLQNVPGAMQVDAVAKLKVKVGEYEGHIGRTRFYFIVQLLEKDLGAGLKNGVSRFESLLAPFGLDGGVPKELQKRLFELAQLRNCIVHNARRVDRQLITACPWLCMIEGDLVKVDFEQLHQSFRAVMDYSAIVVSRACIWHHEDMSKNIDRVFLDWENGFVED